MGVVALSTWLKPTPESGGDCLVCHGRYVDATPDIFLKPRALDHMQELMGEVPL